MNDKIELVTWQDVDEFVKYVCKEVYRRSNGNISGVYGLPRGGLIFAVMLSHRLNIPLLTAPANGCLIVDDICDSGESLLHYVKDSSGKDPKHYTIATMYIKEGGLVEPDIYSKVKTDKWIVFPWEVV